MKFYFPFPPLFLINRIFPVARRNVLFFGKKIIEIKWWNKDLKGVMICPSWDCEFTMVAWIGENGLKVFSSWFFSLFFVNVAVKRFKEASVNCTLRERDTRENIEKSVYLIISLKKKKEKYRMRSF